MAGYAEILNVLTTKWQTREDIYAKVGECVTQLTLLHSKGLILHSVEVVGEEWQHRYCLPSAADPMIGVSHTAKLAAA